VIWLSIYCNNIIMNLPYQKIMTLELLARPPDSASVSRKVANRETLAGHDSLIFIIPWFFFFYHEGTWVVLGFGFWQHLSKWKRERERREETKEKNKKLLFPNCTFRERRRRRRMLLKTTLCFLKKKHEIVSFWLKHVVLFKRKWCQTALIFKSALNV